LKDILYNLKEIHDLSSKKIAQMKLISLTEAFKFNLLRIMMKNITKMVYSLLYPASSVHFALNYMYVAGMCLWSVNMLELQKSLWLTTSPTIKQLTVCMPGHAFIF
jgi:hypothetical protein